MSYLSVIEYWILSPRLIGAIYRAVGLGFSNSAQDFITYGPIKFSKDTWNYFGPRSTHWVWPNPFILKLNFIKD